MNKMFMRCVQFKQIRKSIRSSRKTRILTHKLLEVGLVSGFGDDTLFLQHGQDAHLLFDKLDGGQQVHTEIDKGPLDTLLLVLFLLLDEHVVVKELLQTLVGVVDQKLLQDVELKDLKAGDVQDTFIKARRL